MTLAGRLYPLRRRPHGHRHPQRAPFTCLGELSRKTRPHSFGEDSKSTALAPGREFKVVGEGQLDAGFMASPAVADNALFLRTKTDLYRVQ